MYNAPPTIQAPPPSVRPKSSARWLIFGIVLFVGLALVTIIGALWMFARIRPIVLSETDSPVALHDSTDGWKDYRIRCMSMEVELPSLPKNNVGDVNALPTANKITEARVAGYKCPTSYGHVSIYYVEYRDERRMRDIDALERIETKTLLPANGYSNVQSETRDVMVNARQAGELILHYKYRGKPDTRRVVFIPEMGRTWTLRSFSRAEDDQTAEKDFARVLATWQFTH